MENNKSYEIKKTGTEKTYGAATRCSKEGKGRFDLIPEYVLSKCFESYSNQSYSMFPKAKAFEYAVDGDYVNAITYITQSKYHKCDEKSTRLMDFTKMVMDLAIHFQKGAEMYGYRNCEKGIPLWSFRDSGIRHLIQYINGETDEPHHISAIWNFVMAEWTIIHHPERCDKAGLSLNDNDDDDKKVDDCDNSTTTSDESNDYYGLEHEIYESLKELSCDDEIVKQSSGYNYIKPVNIADIGSSASETREENVKTDTTDNRFVYDELIWNPDVNIDVIRFISQYNNGDEFSKNARDYDGKYSYHFAKLLKSIFDRGAVCYSTCYNKFVWCDDDGLNYCVKGNICTLPSGKLIPENKIPKTIIEFFKNPDCEDYYEKLHIFGYYMKSLLSE